jgi:TatD DNase family protein
LDEMYQGQYNNKVYHSPDVIEVLNRAVSTGVSKFLCTSGSLEDSINTSLFCNENTNFNLFYTVGIHPTRCCVFENDDDNIIPSLEIILNRGMIDHKLAAIGECGLDYDRLQFCSKELQLLGFQKQLDLALQFSLPLFLHNRNTEGDFLRMITKYVTTYKETRQNQNRLGVVHSFTGSVEEMLALTSLGLHIGINGCSLRTEEGLQVAREVPVHLLLLETDAPWCGIKPTHAGHFLVATSFPTVKRDKWVPGMLVKDRNEPCTLIQVLEVVAGVRECDPEELAKLVQANCQFLFGF